MLATQEWAWALVVVTGALALATALLAFSTRRIARSTERTAIAAEQDIKGGANLIAVGQQQVEAVQRQADAALTILQNENQPMLVPAAPSEDFDPTEMAFLSASGRVSEPVQDFPTAMAWLRGEQPWLVIKIRNVGRGPAFLSPEPSDIALDARGVIFWGEPSSNVVGPGDRVTVVFNGAANDPGKAGALESFVTNRMDIVLRYRGVTGGRWFETGFQLGVQRPLPKILDLRFREIQRAAPPT